MAAIPGARALLDAPFAALARHRSQPKLAGVPAFLGSLEGAYFLRRSLFLPAELPSLLGEDMAREGLAALGGDPPGVTSPRARNAAAGVGVLESTLYLRNQLLRDSDWASMAHSLELRSPLVDAQLLTTLGPYSAGFKGGIGKAMLAHAPEKRLPKMVVSRRKTGFSVPMASWLSKWTDCRSWTDMPLLAPARTPWARRWARIVVD
jgi:asparagine synthase (glutamine-hydrolysing)